MPNKWKLFHVIIVQALEWGAPVTEDSVITSNNYENINNQAKDMQVKPTADKNWCKVILLSLLALSSLLSQMSRRWMYLHYLYLHC